MYCVDVVGTQNAHNIISISTDGKMCSWSLDMLSQPQVPVYFIYFLKFFGGHMSIFGATIP